MEKDVIDSVNSQKEKSQKFELEILRNAYFQLVETSKKLKISQENLAVSDENFRLLFESSLDSIMMLEPPDWRFVNCNPASLKLFGVRDKKSFGRFTPWNKLSPLHQPDGELSKTKALRMIDVAMKNGSAMFNWTHRKLNGKTFPASIVLTKVVLPTKSFFQATVRDLTDYSRILEQAKSSENKFRTIYEGVMDGIIAADIKTRDIVFCNKQMSQMLDYSNAELRKLNIADIHPTDKYSEVSYIFIMQSKGLTPLAKNVPVIKKNGTIIYCDISAKKIFIDNREIMLGFFRDVTQQKLVDENLKDSEYFFKESQSVANIGSYKLDITSGNWTSSAVLNKIFGIGKQYEKSIAGWLDLIHPDDKKMMDLYFKDEVVAKHKPFNKEYRIIQKNTNNTCWVSGLGNVKYDLKGKPLYMIGTIQDITDRKNIEGKLKRAHEIKDAILASIGDAVLACDNQGKITMFNRIAEELVGIKSKDAMGKHYNKIINFIRESDSMPCNDFVKDALKYHKITELANHALLVRADGNKIPVADSAAPIINTDGELFGAVVVFHEVTKERSIDKAKTEFVSLASHQLRTPLSTINWYSEILLSEELGKLSPKQRQYIQEVYHASQRMVALVNALLNVSRLELGTFSVEPKIGNIIYIAKMCLKELKPQILIKDLTVKEKYKKSEITCNVDAKLLGMIFSNIFSNSVKYSKKGGEIQISLGIENETISLSVTDHGIGIPSSQQKEIFGKLFRADNAKMTDPDGSGLGLYIVKEIINYAGGKVWFESREGKGTTFYVKIPLSGMKKKISNKRLI